jgi:DNA end-binding protein Ku
MPPHSIGSGTISFGLVSIPVRMYTAASSGGVSFNLLHARCGSRIRQQTFCPACDEVVGRGDLVRGYEFAKDQYVRFTDEELRALEGEASKVLDITDFVPLASVDPIYFEKTYYLGPDKGGEKAYRLLADALARTERAALAAFVMRGKESLVLIRSAQQGLLLHTLYFADEVRDFGEVDKGLSARIREGELDLALRLIEDLARGGFEPQRYRDEYRERVLGAVQAKVEGREVTAAGPEARRAQVIDLMEALKQSLARRPAPARAELAAAPAAAVPTPAAAPAPAAPPLAKKPPAKVARGAPAAQARPPAEAKPAARSRSARGR